MESQSPRLSQGCRLVRSSADPGNARDWRAASIWTHPVALGHKTGTEVLTQVTGATARVSNDIGSFIKPFSVTLTLAQAKRFAAEINALPVDHPVTWTGLAGTPDVTLRFQTPSGPRSFLAIRNAYLVQSLGRGPRPDHVS